jgi:hypothetical protein
VTTLFLSIPEEYLAGLGRIAVQFSSLEDIVGYVATLLISRDEDLGSIVTAEMSFRSRLALVSALGRYRLLGSRVRSLSRS